MLSSDPRSDATTGPDLRELIQLCQLAEWTPELRNAVLTFNIHTAVMPTPEWIRKRKQYVHWEGIMYWLLFIFWCEFHVGILHSLSIT